MGILTMLCDRPYSVKLPLMHQIHGVASQPRLVLEPGIYCLCMRQNFLEFQEAVYYLHTTV